MYSEPEEGRYLEPDKERNLGPGEESHLGLAADSRYTSSQRDRLLPQRKSGNRLIGSESAEYTFFFYKNHIFWAQVERS